jgi:hypothetical protein
MFAHVFATAGFAGGCLLLSVMLTGLLGLAPEESARVMRTLLPRMGSVMAPLLLIGVGSALVLVALAGRAPGALPGGSWIVAGAFVAIGIITVAVHLPLNAHFLNQTPLPSSLELRRWLLWHHLRTFLSAIALFVLLKRVVFAAN